MESNFVFNVKYFTFDSITDYIGLKKIQLLNQVLKMVVLTKV